jgi:SAM-dependent methyltransferase
MSKTADLVAKNEVKAFWEEAACGERLYLSGRDRANFEAQARARYRLEPYIPGFAKFTEARGKRVLEIGVGLGADHQRFAEGGAELFGVDLTERAVDFTRARLEAFGLRSTLSTGDAERLSFPVDHFDIVYSWGVIHHSPDTPNAVAEIFRVLQPGGVARIMIYHTHSFIGLMLWVRYGLMRLRPWRSLSDIYANHLESPGTKAYSRREARRLFEGWTDVQIDTVLTHGDLLEGQAGQRHEGAMLNLARRVWPRALVKRLFPKAGLFMLIEARKPTE